MNDFIILSTDRLLIRDHIIDDLTSHHELFSNDKVMYYLPNMKTHTLDESKSDLLKAIEEIGRSDRTKCFLRIELKESNIHIGDIGYSVTEFTPYGKLTGLGYFTYPLFWNKGYVTEAVKEVLRFAFEDNGVIRISSGCLKDNIGSERVMQKCGMIKEAEHKMFTLLDGKMRDRVEYRITKSEWMAAQKHDMGMVYKYNIPVPADQIADLRQSVGWNRMEGCYKDTHMTSYFHIGCYDDEKLIGYIDTVSNGLTDAYIQDLMVHPGYQGKGIGTELMNRTIDYLKRDHIFMISVIFEEKLLPFYKRFGFENMLSGQMQTYQLK